MHYNQLKPNNCNKMAMNIIVNIKSNLKWKIVFHLCKQARIANYKWYKLFSCFQKLVIKHLSRKVLFVEFIYVSKNICYKDFAYTETLCLQRLTCSVSTQVGLIINIVQNAQLLDTDVEIKWVICPQMLAECFEA